MKERTRINYNLIQRKWTRRFARDRLAL